MSSTILLLCLFALELCIGFLSILILEDVLDDFEVLDNLEVLDIILQFMGRMHELSLTLPGCTNLLCEMWEDPRCQRLTVHEVRGIHRRTGSIK